MLALDRWWHSTVGGTRLFDIYLMLWQSPPLSSDGCWTSTDPQSIPTYHPSPTTTTTSKVDGTVPPAPPPPPPWPTRLLMSGSCASLPQLPKPLCASLTLSLSQSINRPALALFFLIKTAREREREQASRWLTQEDRQL